MNIKNKKYQQLVLIGLVVLISTNILRWLDFLPEELEWFAIGLSIGWLTVCFLLRQMILREDVKESQLERDKKLKELQDLIRKKD